MDERRISGHFSKTAFCGIKGRGSDQGGVGCGTNEANDFQPFLSFGEIAKPCMPHNLDRGRWKLEPEVLTELPAVRKDPADTKSTWPSPFSKRRAVQVTLIGCLNLDRLSLLPILRINVSGVATYRILTPVAENSTTSCLQLSKLRSSWPIRSQCVKACSFVGKINHQSTIDKR